MKSTGSLVDPGIEPNVPIQKLLAGVRPVEGDHGCVAVFPDRRFPGSLFPVSVSKGVLEKVGVPMVARAGAGLELFNEQAGAGADGDQVHRGAKGGDDPPHDEVLPAM